MTADSLGGRWIPIHDDRLPAEPVGVDGAVVGQLVQRGFGAGILADVGFVGLGREFDALAVLALDAHGTLTLPDGAESGGDGPVLALGVDLAEDRGRG